MRKTTTSAPGRVLVCVTALIGILTPAMFAFKSEHHGNVTREVLQEAALSRTINGLMLRFQPWAIDEIIRANIHQDDGALRCGFGIPPGGPFADSSNHFDSEEMNASSQKAKDRLNDAVKALMRPSPNGAGARRLLGQVLHGAQDYYAHSNWVETQNGTDPRLAVSLFSAVPLTTATCQAPPNTGTYVPGLTGLTSGYWFGCYGNAQPVPAGKCYHGLSEFGQNYAGTNKDHTDREGYTEARESAKDSTRAIINRLLDSNGIAGNLNRTAALMGYRTLAFVIDTTGGCPDSC